MKPETERYETNEPAPEGAGCPSEGRTFSERLPTGCDAAYNAAIAAVRRVAEGVPDWLITVAVNAAQPHLTGRLPTEHRERAVVEVLAALDEWDRGRWGSFAVVAQRVVDRLEGARLLAVPDVASETKGAEHQ